MNVLDTIDTTVTFEWGNTRTVGSLVRLEGRAAVVTSLRAPDEGTPVYLRLEGESEVDGIALDGICACVAESEWGERLVEINVQRVGTTASATVLRDFIEAHGIVRGGSVSVGRHRDDPDLKRFVYTLPEVGQEARLGEPATGESMAYAPGMFGADQPQAGRGDGEMSLSDSEETTDPGVAMASGAPASRPMAADTGATQQMAAITGASLMRDKAAPPRTATEVPQQVDLIADDEPILVNTVEEGVAHPAPVMPAVPPKPAPKPPPEGSLLSRLLGGLRRKDSRTGQPAATPLPAPTVTDDAAAPAPLPALSDAGPTQEMSAPFLPPQREGRVSAGLTAVQALFATDQAIRVEMPVMFESGKKKRTGVLLRLSESKLRIRSAHQPELYERMTVTMTGSGGPKDLVLLRCEITRVRLADGEGGESAFDARLTGGNPPATMSKLRAIIAQFGQGEAM